MNIVDLIDHSATIVAGRVEKVTDGFTAAGLPYTEVTVHVLDRFRGVSGNTFTFRQFGLSAPRTMPDGKVYLGGRPEGWPTFRTWRSESAVPVREGTGHGLSDHRRSRLRQARHG